ncbi:patatin-like phospholipase family protein [Sinorhizobium americanum]|uniref:Patatin n=1 Tax=Sinorhizobium americanum TaxID=194963 RepID=A0A1L3LSP8_9HYPH|nr:patatin-like phospholipase family protein [Sinorhizobium americanum]APG93109.1 patatin [Sinorhizobium americanum]OAP50007.1 patatin [Sinorhizobium americanum]
MSEQYFRVLSLDGGGAKGFYTLGVLHEIEGLIGRRLYERFDLIFGTSTGSIIAALLALGYSIDEIYSLYKEHVVSVVARKKPHEKSAALAELSRQVFGERKFDEVKTNVGIVAAKWAIEKPMIFKGNIEQAHGRHGTWVPGFAVTIGDAVQASCSAYPFFEKKIITTSAGVDIELIDGGYCANNPTLYAIADATIAMKVPPEKVRVVSIGVGNYPEPKLSIFHKSWWFNKVLSVQLLQKTLSINTESMDQLRAILFKHIETVRISDTFEKPELATDLFEHDMGKLNMLRLRGMESFASREAQLKEFLL